PSNAPRESISGGDTSLRARVWSMRRCCPRISLRTLPPYASEVCPLTVQYQAGGGDRTGKPLPGCSDARRHLISPSYALMSLHERCACPAVLPADTPMALLGLPI